MSTYPNEIEFSFRSRKEDYLAFYKYYFFRRRIVLRIVLLALLGNFVATVSLQGGDLAKTEFSLGQSAIILLTVAVYLILPYFLWTYQLRKKLATDQFLLEEKTVKLSAAGILVISGSDEVFWKYSSVRLVQKYKDHLYILLFGRTLYAIPIGALVSESLVVNVQADIQHGIEIAKIKGEYRPRHLYYLGFAELIPVWGLMIGIVLIVMGITKYKDKWLVIIGSGGILTTAIFIWFMSSDRFARYTRQGFAEMTQGKLNTLMKEVEFYKMEHGSYPDSLTSVTRDDKYSSTVDFVAPHGKDGKVAVYQYHKIGEKYTLYSVGLDGIAGTVDDIYPTAAMNDTAKFGLIRAK